MNDKSNATRASASPYDLRLRARDYALRIISLYGALPRITKAQVLGTQLLRKGTSVAALYREAHRAKSNADFDSKLDGVIGELDESDLWLDLIVTSGIMKAARLQPPIRETQERIAIFVAPCERVKNKRRK